MKPADMYLDGEWYLRLDGTLYIVYGDELVEGPLDDIIWLVLLFRQDTQITKEELRAGSIIEVPWQDRYYHEEIGYFAAKGA